LAFGGFALGLLSLVYYDAWMKARRRKSFLGPGAASATELERSHFTGLTPARWLSLFIASGIGLHNFSEGLAIGQAGAKGTLSLAYVLVIGFGLHNATEGFGIVAPLSGVVRRRFRTHRLCRCVRSEKSGRADRLSHLSSPRDPIWDRGAPRYRACVEYAGIYVRAP